MGDEAFRQLSMVDPKGNELLNKVWSFNATFLFLFSFLFVSFFFLINIYYYLNT